MRVAALLLGGLLWACSGGLLTGRFYYQDGEYERAREELERALAVEPDNAQLHYWLAKTHAEFGDYAGMATAIDRCLELTHEHAAELDKLRYRVWQSERELGSHLMTLRPPDLGGALSAFRNAATVRRQDTESLRDLALVYARLDCTRAAMVLYEDLLRRDPADAQALAALGALHMGAGRFEAAAVAYASLVEMNPYDAESLVQLAGAQEQLGHFDEAARVYGEVALLVPEDPFVDVSLGRLYERMGDVDRALQAYSEALAKSTGDPGALHDLARIHLECGDDDAALPLLELLSVRMPEEAQVWRQLERIYGLRGMAEHGARARDRVQALEVAE